MQVVEFEPAHVQMIEDAGGRQRFGPFPFQNGYADMCADSVFAWSAFVDGKILGCAGVHPDHARMGTAWSLLMPNTGKHMVAITRLARREFDKCPLERIQAHVSPNFAPAIRWIEMLGFVCECPRIRKFTDRGDDVALYVRIRE